MSRVAIVLVALSLAACNLADAKVTGSGPARTEARTVPDFTGIEVRGSIEVDVTVGGARSVEVTADDNVVPVIRTEVKKGRLVIDSTDSYTTKRRVRVTITVPALDALATSGSSHARVRGVDTAGLALAVSGSGAIEASGKTGALTLAVSGSGRIAARGVAADQATVAVSGSGAVELRAADALQVMLSGSGKVDYWGNPAVTKMVSGSGSLRRH